ncbi:MAG: sigma 54-interacting transcriptional regulator [Planctomycetes bacterium]|nr:sigma 54-interacting transcriptional regulator [Planctomycetota bacterium]
MPNVLVAWLGNTDLKAVSDSESVGLGPIAQAVESRPFDRAVLLSDHSELQTGSYCSWLGKRSSKEVECIAEKLKSPTDFEGIYRAAVRGLTHVLQRHGPDTRLTLHLSPGTPAMAAVWIILAKTRFPAKLIESSRQQGVREVEFPFDLAADFLPDLLSQATQRLQEASQAPAPASASFSNLIYRSGAMKQLVQRASQAASLGVPVLIEGESGTGKELLAKAIHSASKRANYPFVAVNCGAIPETLIEAELFGYEKGAFTGAQRQVAGLFERGSGGTVFLDEIGELPLSAQVKFLRALQEGEVQRLGGSSPLKVDVRIVAATNRNLIAEVQAGRFREDLFFRLAVAVLRVPPLRDRPEDVGPLLEHYSSKLNLDLFGSTPSAHKKLSVGARKLLQSHPWPGNIRELISTLQRALVWSPSVTITEAEAREAILGQPARRSGADGLSLPLDKGFNLQGLLDRTAVHYLERALEESQGNKTKAAKLLGLPSYQTLTNWLRRYGLEHLARR